MPITCALVPLLIWLTASSSAARPRATIATSPPDSAKRRPIAKPMPLEPPVTMAERPLREISMSCPIGSSCPASCRASAPLVPSKEDVDGRDKPGHDELRDLPHRLVRLRLEPDKDLAAAELQHRPLDDRGLRQLQLDRLRLGQALLVRVGQLAERGAGLV